MKNAERNEFIFSNKYLCFRRCSRCALRQEKMRGIFPRHPPIILLIQI
ncbi:hypothetical protein [Inovirus D_HF5_61]|nr:hypothetical protein [Inovirus D_HF5_61]DAR03083.1 MAG TPA: hypothetical protein [Inoviridae sp.]